MHSWSSFFIEFIARSWLVVVCDFVFSAIWTACYADWTTPEPCTITAERKLGSCVQGMHFTEHGEQLPRLSVWMPCLPPLSETESEAESYTYTYAHTPLAH